MSTYHQQQTSLGLKRMWQQRRRVCQCGRKYLRPSPGTRRFPGMCPRCERAVEGGEDAMIPTYHLEHHPGRWELWRTGGPCVAILPADQDRQEAEQLAAMLLAAANGEEGKK